MCGVEKFFQAFFQVRMQLIVRNHFDVIFKGPKKEVVEGFQKEMHQSFLAFSTQNELPQGKKAEKEPVIQKERG